MHNDKEEKFSTFTLAPTEYTCSVCKEAWYGGGYHTCAPHLLKRIEALEKIVNKFICDGK
jgi:hypothetical protein